MKIIFGNKVGLGRREKIDPEKPYFIAQDFPIKRKESTWNNFPSKLLIQPEKIVPYQFTPTNYFLPPPISRNDTPDLIQWISNVENVIESPVDKVVLARRSTFEFTDRIDPVEVINMLHQKAQNALVFGFILSPTLAFVGATPELLIRRRDRVLQTEALAGTRLLGQEEELVASEKDRKEFGIVKESIADSLKSCAHPFSMNDDVYVKQTTKLCHLHYPFEVELKDEISDEELIKALHPTPALGGLPKIDSLKLIEELETFDRGWYAGTLGMLSNSYSEVYVGIRAAIIEENRMHLFSGAGIVNDSSPLCEWEELNNKLAQFGNLEKVKL